MSGVPCGPAAPAALPHPALPAPPPHPALDAELLEHLSPALALPDPPAVPAPLPPHPLGAVGHLPVAVSHARGFPAALPVVPLRERAVPRSAAPRRAP